MYRKYIGRPFTPRKLREMLTALKLSEGRPRRKGVINNDDILNLRISLETTKSVNEFLNALEATA